MKKRKHIIIAILLVSVLLTNFSCIKKQKEKIKLLENKISLLKEEHIPVRFKISEKTDDSIQLTVKFYNADNKEINKLETIVPGQELSFDFYVVPVKDRYVAFPSKLFSNVIAASEGTSFYDLYDKDGYPEVFRSENIDPEIFEGLKEVFQHVRADQTDSLKNYFGNMVHDIRSFKSFVPEMVYSIVTHTKGGIEIVEE